MKNTVLQLYWHTITSIGKLLRSAFTELLRNDPLRMASATAFFTTFALPPILIILIQTLGLVFNPDKISQQLFERLESLIGTASTHQVVETLTGFRKLAQNWFVTIGGFVFLVFVATTLFKVIKGSINQIWKIKVTKQRSLWLRLMTRLQAVFVIIVAGLLFVIGLLAEGAQAFLKEYIQELFPQLANYFNNILNMVVSVIIVTIWFAIMFRLLPDSRPKWKVVAIGALVTSLLFNLGKYVLRWLLTYSNIDNVYGTSASIVLLLLFVFYSSFILYYGAAFTKVWAQHTDSPIRPLPYAMHYKLIETDEEITYSKEPSGNFEKPMI